MRRQLIVFVLFTLLLSSCNLPTGSSTPDADIIATRVAATLAAAKSTATEESQPTVSLPTVSQETATNGPTATATLTPTPTVNPEDPKLTLGTPDFQFSPASSGDPWGVVGDPYEDQAVVISNQTDGLHFASKTVNGGKRWRLTSPTPTDFYLEGTFKVVTCTGKDNYGLVMRVPSYNDTLGYFIGLSCSGNYIVDWIDESGNAENIISWTQDEHINTGAGQTNRLGVMLEGDQFKIYINGSLAGEFSDASVASAGHVGVYVSARENPGFTVVLEELLEWDK